LEDLNPVKIQVMVGQSVDIEGQSGNPTIITGFQIFKSALLTAHQKYANFLKKNI
jgi:hypothetical protein